MRVALICVLLIGCSSLVQPPPWQSAAIEYESLSLEYESLANRLVAARARGDMDGNQWREFASIQERVGTMSYNLDALFAEWEQTGLKPSEFDAAVKELRDEMVRLRKLADRVATPSARRLDRPTRKAA